MMKAIGILIFLSGAYGIYWSGKQAFERRNSAGVEEFSSYASAVGRTALEAIIKLAGWAGIMLGFLTFCIGFGFGK